MGMSNRLNFMLDLLCSANRKSYRFLKTREVFEQKENDIKRENVKRESWNLGKTEEWLWKGKETEQVEELKLLG